MHRLPNKLKSKIGEGENMGILEANDMSTITKASLFGQLAQKFGETYRSDTSALAGVRKLAFDTFEQKGFPTVKHEDWKYTNIQPLVNRSYVFPEEAETYDVDYSAAVIPGLDAHRLVLVNGKFVENLSDIGQEAGLVVKSILEASDDKSFERHFAQYADKTGSSPVLLNTALFERGVFVLVKKGAILSKPLHIVHITSGAEDLFVQTRNLFIVEANAELEIIESFISSGKAAQNLHNNVTEIVLEENAKVQHYALQLASANNRYINHIEVYQKKHSLYNNYNCTFPGATFVRNDINVRLDDEQVESHLYGINLLADDQLVDNHTIVDHLKPHCESYEWYKNIPQDNATAVFNGKIFVREDAQKTNAFQQNNNMLIGDQSAVYSKPQLEIFADDVKCSHGCTIGQFDEQALFYLRARGIGEESARTLLVHAFAFDVTSRFTNDVVREYVELLVAKGLERRK